MFNTTKLRLSLPVLKQINFAINCKIRKNKTTNLHLLQGMFYIFQTCILLNAYTMAHDEENFVNAEDFMPERWLRGESKDSNPFSMLPFGFGSRMCVGRRIAEQELYLALTRVGFFQKSKNLHVVWYTILF